MARRRQRTAPPACREPGGTSRTLHRRDKGATVVTLRGAEASGSLSLPQPGTVVRIVVESGPA
jgi:hypothetical protein